MIGMDSCFSWGNTSRNQPTQPASVKIAPRMLTEVLVTNPAKTNVRPKARMIGHAVGAGSSIVFCIALSVSGGSSSVSEGIFQYLSSSSNHVHDRENDNPHHVSEVDRETAGKQTDRIDDRDTENILRHGPRQALAEIKDVSHHEDCENSSFGCDQTLHSDASAIGKIPLKPRSGHRH